MNVLRRFDDNGTISAKPCGHCGVTVDGKAAANAVHLMQRDARARLHRDKGSRRQSATIMVQSVVTKSAIMASAACLVPLAITAFGLSRIARGRIGGLAGDAAVATRAVWRSTSAAVEALVEGSASGR